MPLFPSSWKELRTAVPSSGPLGERLCCDFSGVPIFISFSLRSFSPSFAAALFCSVWKGLYSRHLKSIGQARKTTALPPAQIPNIGLEIPTEDEGWEVGPRGWKISAKVKICKEVHSTTILYWIRWVTYWLLTFGIYFWPLGVPWCWCLCVCQPTWVRLATGMRTYCILVSFHLTKPWDRLRTVLSVSYSFSAPSPPPRKRFRQNSRSNHALPASVRMVLTQIQQILDMWF